MEVRRVTTVSTQKASKPERSSRSGFALKGFYMCKKASLVRSVARQVGCSSRSRRSLIYEARHIVPPSDPCVKQRGRRAGSPRRYGRNYAGTADGFARTINPVHTMSDGDKIFASSKGKASVRIDVSALRVIAATVMPRAVLQTERLAEHQFSATETT